MRETWRWYGPDLDPISLTDIAQTGAAGIGNALHEVPYGKVWMREATAVRKRVIAAAGFTWDVVESCRCTSGPRAATAISPIWSPEIASRWRTSPPGASP